MREKSAWRLILGGDSGGMRAMIFTPEALIWRMMMSFACFVRLSGIKVALRSLINSSMDSCSAHLLKMPLRARMRKLARQWRGDSTLPCEHVGIWLAKQQQELRIAIFHPLPGEADLLPLMAAHPQHRWYLPRVSGDDLEFHQVMDVTADLQPGAYGILEPNVALPRMQAEDMDIFMCPGLGFDARGGRLGRGKGFYDRLLAKARPGAWKIGVGLPFQWVEDTYMEPHDIPMDLIFCGLPSRIGNDSLPLR